MNFSRILFFGFSDFSLKMKAEALQQQLTLLGYDCYQIGPESGNRKIYEIVHMPEASGSPGLLTLPVPFILFCGLTGDQLQTALDVCKGNIRAVLTPANSMMTPYELCTHLAEERKHEIQRREKR